MKDHNVITLLLFIAFTILIGKLICFFEEQRMVPAKVEKESRKSPERRDVA